MLTTSPATRERIKEHESLRLKAYYDSGGVLTIGYGHCGLDVTAGMVIDLLEAEILLAGDIARVESGVRRVIGDLPITQNQFDALVSFAFNVGLHALRVSTLIKKFRVGDYAGAADEFARWVHIRSAPGQLSNEAFAELVKRRAEERDLFLSA